MNDKTGFGPAHGATMKALVRYTRARPEQFAAGRAFLEKTFTFDAIRARDRAECEAELRAAETSHRVSVRRERAAALRQLREAGNHEYARRLRTEPTPADNHFLRHVRDDVRGRFGPANFETIHGSRFLPQQKLAAWLIASDTTKPNAHLGTRMSITHAEAVLLVLVFFWDRSQRPNPAIPEFMRRIPWGEPEGTGGDFLAHRWPWVLDADRERLDDVLQAATTRFEVEHEVELAQAVGPQPRAQAGGTPRPVRGKPAESVAYEGFILACELREDLSTTVPSAEHHQTLLELRPELLVGRAKANAETWVAYARRGRLATGQRIRGVRKEAGRSITRAEDI
ncbi:MAG: hypothetical protein JNK02_01710 [Planctomycetes bacterium]|nr:hypothetical protein [Planctomycetota bacterium]